MATIKARLKTPADPNGRRDLIDIVTGANAVVCENGQSLTENLKTISQSILTGGIVFSESDHKPSGPILWGEIYSDIHYR